MSKLILDACCGGRMCWFDKAHKNALYIDHREAAKGHVELRPNHEVCPDKIVDFREMPFADNSFKLILFDPPHMLLRNGKEGLMAKKYGFLRSGWKEDLSKGFSECWRVLDDYGTMIFKWSSSEIKLKEVLLCFNQQPLFGHTTTRSGTTHWLTFMKIPK